MARFAILALAAALAASPAWAQDEVRHAAADGFAPFDQQADSDGWVSISPQPLYLTAGVDKPAGAPLTLQPGSYRIVVICDCGMMEVTMLRPDNSPIAAERSDDRRAMYSVDVPTAGAYLAGIDMDDCSKAECEVALKVYRKKDG